MQQRAFGPVTHPLQGLAQMLMAYKSRRSMESLDADYDERGRARNRAFAEALTMARPSTRETRTSGPPTRGGVYPSITETIPGDPYGAGQIMLGEGDYGAAENFWNIGFGQEQGRSAQAREDEIYARGRADTVADAAAKRQHALALKGLDPTKTQTVNLPGGMQQAQEWIGGKWADKGKPTRRWQPGGKDATTPLILNADYVAGILFDGDKVKALEWLQTSKSKTPEQQILDIATRLMAGRWMKDEEEAMEIATRMVEAPIDIPETAEGLVDEPGMLDRVGEFIKEKTAEAGEAMGELFTPAPTTSVTIPLDLPAASTQADGLPEPEFTAQIDRAKRGEVLTIDDLMAMSTEQRKRLKRELLGLTSVD